MMLRPVMQLTTVIVLIISGTESVTRKIKDKNYWIKYGQDELNRVLKEERINNVAKNVILVIGDGYGLESVTASRIYKGELEGRKMDDEARIQTDDFQNVALVRTMCTDRMVGSSDCTASAILNGVKVRDLVVNVDDTIAHEDCEAHLKDKERSTETLISIAHKSGRSTGIVTNTRITHATPAAVYGSTVSRYWERDSQISENCRVKGYKDLGRQLVEDNHYINVLFGGGRREMLPNTTSDPESGQGERADNKNLIELWEKTQKDKKKTYKYVTNKADFDRLTPNLDFVLGLFENSEMKYEEDRKLTNDEPCLSDMARKAIKILEKNNKGFFLVIESGLIDRAHHATKARYALAEGVELDNVVKTILELTNKEETLLIVTGDHGHNFKIGGYPKMEIPILGVSHQLSDIDKMPYTILSYGDGPNYKRQNLTQVDTTALNYMQQSTVPNTEASHGGADLAVYGHGTMSHLIRGNHLQPYISQVMRYAACMKPYDQTRRCDEYKNNVSKLAMTSSMLLFTVTVVYRFSSIS